jgi:murein DD-endopeptidase MepM/ murein hydrolase activator NlpD
MTLRKPSHNVHRTFTQNSIYDSSDHKDRPAGTKRAAKALVALVFFASATITSVGPASANINSPQGALDIAGIVPGKYSFMEITQKTVDSAEATVSSVKAIAGLMKQAIDVAAMLPEDSPDEVASKPSVFVPVTDVDIALKVVSMVPSGEARPVASAAQLMQTKNLLWPVNGYIYSAFNATRSRGRVHGAVDIVTEKDTPIAVTADGIVSVAANGGAKFKGYGKTVIVDHGNGVHTLYSHCNTILVKMGQKVKRGEFIATVGRTGSATTDHVHFEVRVSGKKVDPLNFLPSRPEMVKAKNWKSKKS